jgi:drug/metabolite transporter (DMT)-like permease
MSTPNSSTAPTGQLRAYLALTGGIFCIGFSPVFIGLADVPGDVATTFRLGIAGLGLSILMGLNLARKRVRLPRSLILLVLIAGTLFAIDTTLWAIGVRQSGAGKATLLSNTAPIWVGLGAWLFFKESLKARYWIGLITALGGTALVIGFNPAALSSMNIGDIAALGAGVAYGAYQLVTQSARKSVDSLTFTWLFSSFGALVAFSLTRVTGNSLLGWPPLSYLALLGAGLISHLGGWTLINYALGKLRASLVSVILLFQPVLAGIIAVPVLGEIPGARDLGGGLIILAGIYLVHLALSASPVEPAKEIV